MANNPLYKGSLNTIILMMLSNHGRMYGYELTHRVKELTDGEINISQGALYPALHKLEEEGLVKTEEEEVNNRTRKYYRLTDKGEKEMVEKLNELSRFIQHMDAILNQ